MSYYECEKMGREEGDESNRTKMVLVVMKSLGWEYWEGRLLLELASAAFCFSYDLLWYIQFNVQ